MVKKLLIVLFFFLILVTGCAQKEEPLLNDLQVIKDRDKLIVGVRDDTKPFGYRDNAGNLVGFDVELARLVAEHLLHDPSKIEFVVVRADDRIETLNSRQVDMLIATMTITQQRLRVVDFSEAYFVAGQAVMVKSNSRYSTFNELADKTLIVVYGTTGEKSLRDIYPTAKIIAFKTYSEAFAAFKNGEADAIVADDTVLRGYSLDDKSVRLLSKRYSREPYAIAFRQGAEADSLEQVVNEFINYLLSTGNLKKIAAKYGLL